MRRQHLLNDISGLLTRFMLEIELETGMGHSDKKVIAEDVVASLLNEIYGWNLVNMNAKKSNYPAVDLADAEERLAVQVTATRTSDKVVQTLNTFEQHKFQEVYDRLIIFVLSMRKNPTPSSRVKELASRLKVFDPQEGHWNFNSLLASVKSLDPDAQERVRDTLRLELGSALPVSLNSQQRFDAALAAHRASISARLDSNAFGEPHSLRDLYLPLRAYYYIDGAKGTGTYHLVDAETYLLAWLAKPKSETANRLKAVSGGPGSGKSTLVLSLAKKVNAQEADCDVLLIDLQGFRYKPEYLRVSLVEHFQNHFGIENFNVFSRQEKTLLIFDGLDEVSLISDQADQRMREFIRELKGLLAGAKNNLHCLLTGRTQVVKPEQSKALTGAAQVLELASYCPKKLSALSGANVGGDIDTDQRPEWWRNYAQLTPEIDLAEVEATVLREDGPLADLTIEPLLNYFIAILLKSGKTISAGVRRNEIYAKLVELVFKREWGKGGNVHADRLELRQFLILLEHVAWCAW